MFLSVLCFEFRYQLRRPVFLVCLLAAIIFSVLLVTGMAESANAVQRQITMNSPVMTARLLTIFSAFGLIIPLVIFGSAVLRDQHTGMEALVKAAPVSLSRLLLARFIAAFLAVSMIFLLLIPFVELALHMPWVDPLIVGPFRPVIKLQIGATLYLLNLFIFASFLFATLCWTRSFAAGYLVLAVFLTLLVVMNGTALKFSQYWYGALADPFGVNALNQIIRFWPPVDQNERAIPVEGVLLWNRLAWSGTALLLLLGTVLFLPRRVRSGKPQIDERAASVGLSRAHATIALQQLGPGTLLLKRLGFETGYIFKSWSFNLFLILLIGTAVSYLYIPDPEQLQPFYPIPAMIAPRVAGIAILWGFILLFMMAGEAVWRERRSRISEILDASPASSFIFFMGKLGAITIALVAFMTVAALAGIIFQLQYGTPDLQPGVYAVYVYLVAGLPLVMFAVLALLIHILAPNKFIGHIATLSFLVAQIVAQYWGIENRLVLFGSFPDIPISVMNGFGHYIYATIWHAAYWGGITLLLGVAIHLLWMRGQNSTLRMRLASVPVFEKQRAFAVALLGLLIAGTAGGYIFWNQHIRHGYYTARSIERGQADYERKFGRFIVDPQPQISKIELAIDIDPHERTLAVRGQYDLINRTEEPVEAIRVQFNDELRREMVEIEGAQLESFDPAFTDYIFRPAVPLAPGATLTLRYAGHLSDAGFKHIPAISSINDNGTFINSQQFAPSIGVTPQMFLSDEARRQKLGLSNHLQVVYRSKDRNLLSHDSDLVDLKLTVSTTSDQTAIAPGVLKREWVDGARKYFQYETDHPIRNFWSIQSGQYDALRAKWRDVDLEVYHHPLQGQKAPRMLSAMRQSLDYYTKAFGPFQFRQLRIAEFPYSTIARSFPSTIAYAEAGFMTAPYKADIADFTGFVTAHEVAHQWWGHQVVPADMPGAQFLSETLAEYSAFMVMEEIHGPDHIRSFLKKDLEEYLAQRAKGDAEVPLSEVKPHQSHIAYKKGALAMYALKDVVGQLVMNRALRRYLEKYRNKAAPYPIAKDLIAILREEAGPANDQLITDLFERITLWDFTAFTVFAAPRKDGKWKITLNVGGQKLDSDFKGTETAAEIDNVVDIGLFAVNPADKQFGSQDVILMERRRLNSGIQSFEFVTDRRPEFAGINPYLKLIERNVGDNIAAVKINTNPN